MLKSCRASLRRCRPHSSVSAPLISRRSSATTKVLPIVEKNTKKASQDVAKKSAEKDEAANPALLTLTYPNLNLYTQVAAPTSTQLTTASKFFVKHRPHYLFTAAHFRDFPAESSIPEITFLGRSNVGKSSLLNALFNRMQNKTALAHVSSRPGKTKTMNVFGLGQEGTEEGRAGGGSSKILKAGMGADLVNKAGPKGGRQQDQNTKGPTPSKSAPKNVFRRENWLGRGGVAVVDCPGYGYASRQEWGQEVIHYLQNRKQLRRAFILIDAEHGLKATDRDILSILRESSVPHQIILSKADKILGLGPKIPGPEIMDKRLRKLRKICEQIKEEIQPNQGRGPVALGDVLCCSAERNWEGKRLGLDGLRWAVLQASGLSEGSGKRSTVDLLDFGQGPPPKVSAWT